MIFKCILKKSLVENLDYFFNTNRKNFQIKNIINQYFLTKIEYNYMNN